MAVLPEMVTGKGRGGLGLGGRFVGWFSGGSEERVDQWGWVVEACRRRWGNEERNGLGFGRLFTGKIGEVNKLEQLGSFGWWTRQIPSKLRRIAGKIEEQLKTIFLD